MTENSKLVLNYLKEHDGEDFTSKDLSTALGIQRTGIDGIVTKGLGKTKAHPQLATRVPVEIEDKDEEGNLIHRNVKFIVLTDEGRAFDPEAPVAE